MCFLHLFQLKLSFSSPPLIFSFSIIFMLMIIFHCQFSNPFRDFFLICKVHTWLYKCFLQFLNIHGEIGALFKDLIYEPSQSMMDSNRQTIGPASAHHPNHLPILSPMPLFFLYKMKISYLHRVLVHHGYHFVMFFST